MALFKPDQQKSMQRSIDDSRANRDRLSAKLGETETSIVEHRAAAYALARDGADDEVLGKAEAATRVMEDRKATMAGAIVEVEQQLAGLEREQADQADAKTRRETIVEIELMANDLEKIAREIDPLLARMVAITAKASAGQIYDARGLEIFATASKIQIPDATKMVVGAIREHIVRVMDKRSPAALMK
jgi:phage terminase Nu1 subunit (DNA packaging protein)